MKKIELIGKRKPKEKHFLQEDGTILVEMYKENIHYNKNGHYEEIDNKLELKNDFLVNEKNDFNIKFATKTSGYIMNLIKNDKYIDIGFNEINDTSVNRYDNKSKFYEKLQYKDILKNIDLIYEIMLSKIKESIIIKNKDSEIDKLIFNISTNAILKENGDGSISVMDDLNNVLFMFDLPFIIDSENNINSNVRYKLEKIKDSYQLSLIYDKDWLYNEAVFPVTIDPTIINYSTDNNVIDTYIYPGDTNDPRGSLGVLKVGVESQNVINRSLIKFNLPELGTGSQVIKAELFLTDYPDTSHSYYDNMVDVHRVTQDWLENTADWNTMNDKYDTRIDAAFLCIRRYYYSDGHYTYLSNSQADITPLVQKWYTGEPNYGIMLKASDEIFHNEPIAIFFSKDNVVTNIELKPVLRIVYRNQNGLEDYMNYETQTFKQCTSYHNLYNGNLTHVINTGLTKNCELPINLKLIYNTNNIVLNFDVGCGLGYKFNYYQTIRPQVIGSKTYLEYLDDDGTLHYFLNERREMVEGVMQLVTYENTYFDEDNLGITIEKETTKYIMKDKNNNIKEFVIISDVGYLNKIIYLNNEINIVYDNQNRIISLVDGDNQAISISYVETPNKKIIISNPDGTGTTIEYQSNSIANIVFNYNNDSETMYYTNVQNLISSILDTNGKRISYEYYNQSPYKLKKVVEYGINQAIGKYYETEYGFNVTSITNQSDRIKRIVFNYNGAASSLINLSDENTISNAYGSKIKFGDDYNSSYSSKNKLLENNTLIKSVKNLLKNTSFEEDTIYFKRGEDFPDITISDEYAYTGDKSLKYRSYSGMTDSRIYQKINVEGGKYYTFSAYVKNVFWNTPVRIYMVYEDNNGIHSEYSDYVLADDFTRIDVSIYVSEDIIDDELRIGFNLSSTGLVYIDDIQLEEGRIANDYNLIENSDFSEGLTGWEFYSEDETRFPISNVFSIENNNQQSMLKVNMSSFNASNFKKYYNIHGKMHEKFTLSFWYKNNGISGGFDEIGSQINNNVLMIFYPVDENIGGDVIDMFQLNPCENQWQFFSYDFIAPFDFKKIEVFFGQSMNGNDFYITNMVMFKNLPSINYEYDSNGNLKKKNNNNNKVVNYSYDTNNQITGILDSKGKSFYYEYDNNDINKVKRGISNIGISNEVEYDIKNHPKNCRIINRGYSNLITAGNYKIRLKGEEKYISIKNKSIFIKEEKHSPLEWNIQIETIDDKNYYKLSHNIINNSYISVNNNALVFSTYNYNYSLFEFIKQENGSFLIKNKENEKYIKYENNTLVCSDLNDDKELFEFYFENCVNNLFFENNALYDSNLKYITDTIDTDLNRQKYFINSNNGFLDSIEKPNGKIIDYSYDSVGRMIQIKSKDRIIDYEYNSYNKLKKITQGSRVININYDNFLNVSSININNNCSLIQKTYNSNNGPLNRIDYGNNQSISFNYDEFDRISHLNRYDNIYEYLYDSNGNIARIISNDEILQYRYDLNKNPYEYKNGNFSFKYIYDINGNIINRCFNYNGSSHSVIKNLDNDDTLTSVTFDNNSIDYLYDSSGRLISENINNNYPILYTYYDKGYRCSNNIKTINNNGDIYEYVYNKSNLINKIIHNNIVESKFYYNDFNELIREDDCINLITIRYFYDDIGNIQNVKKYKLDTFDLLSVEKYSYNPNWKDQLISFDNKTITYDGAGNITSIGNDINLGWMNGKMLSSYSNLSYNISFKYNHDGIRTAKTVNNNEINYYLEGSKIILERNQNNMIYYIWVDDDIIGFNYNNNLYYYEKNKLGDIIGIIDSNYDLIARYQYDSWGRIISITDASGLDISGNSNNVANINPFRYRGYYYDIETNLYYLNNRYYSPMLRRFISTDDILSFNKESNNIYSYSSNDPINNVDYSGQKKKKNKKKKNSFGAFVSSIWSAVSYVANKVLQIKADIETTFMDSPTLDLQLVTYSHGVKATTPIGSLQGDNSSLFSISATTPSQIFSFEDGNIINLPTISVETNNGLFDIKYSSLVTKEMSLKWYTPSGYQQFTYGQGIAANTYFELGSVQTSEEGIEVYDYNHFSINPLILAFAVVVLVESAQTGSDPSEVYQQLSPVF